MKLKEKQEKERKEKEEKEKKQREKESTERDKREKAEKLRKQHEIGDEKKQQQPAKTMQDYIPDGLKSQLRVGTKSNQDQDVIRERQQLVRSKSPAQLSEFHHVGDLPIPSMLHRTRPTSPELEKQQKDRKQNEKTEMDAKKLKEKEETDRQKQQVAQLAKEEEDRKATDLKEREK